jgi:hypothetical protein
LIISHLLFPPRQGARARAAILMRLQAKGKMAADHAYPGH